MRRVRTMFALFCLTGILSVGLIGGCAGTDDPGEDNGCVDNDGDGFNAKTEQCTIGQDCNDNNSNIHPNASEDCGNSIDDDCSGTADDGPMCEGGDVCVDEDNDGYGNGPDCPKEGEDCDDSDADINPGADEVCGNDVDENCDDEAPECEANCTDEDGDGYGAEGATDGCDKDAVDCDDADADINPGADEVCGDDTDNDCDMMTDECDNGGTCQEVDGEYGCRVSVGQECANDKECEEGLKCDTGATPSQCRKVRGEGCQENECSSDLSCVNGSCSGGWCEENASDCGGNTAVCDGNRKMCVQCKYWGSNAGASCNSDESCVGHGWCGKVMTLDSSEAAEGYQDVSKSMLSIMKGMADCWNETIATKKRTHMCYGMKVASSVSGPLTDSAFDTAYKEIKKAKKNGNLKGLTEEQFSALQELHPDGITDAYNYKWKTEVQGDTDQEYCLWYEEDTFEAVRDGIFVDKCTEFRMN